MLQEGSFKSKMAQNNNAKQIYIYTKIIIII